MQMTGLAGLQIIRRELVGPAIEREATGGDAIAKAADQAAEECGMRCVFFGGVEAEDDIAEFPRAIRHEQADNSATIIGDVGLQTVRKFQREELSSATIRDLTEGLGIHEDWSDEFRKPDFLDFGHEDEPKISSRERKFPARP